MIMNFINIIMNIILKKHLINKNNLWISENIQTSMKKLWISKKHLINKNNLWISENIQTNMIKSNL